MLVGDARMRVMGAMTMRWEKLREVVWKGVWRGSWSIVSCEVFESLKVGSVRFKCRNRRRKLNLGIVRLVGKD